MSQEMQKTEPGGPIIEMFQSSFPFYEESDFYQSLSTAAQADLDSMIFPTDHEAHTILFSESDLSEEILIILEGEVRLSINSSDGRHLRFRTAKAGEVLGLSSVVLGQNYDMTAEVVCPATVAHISREMFLLFLNSHRGVYQPVARELIRTYGGRTLQPRDAKPVHSETFFLQLANA
jgi:CRP-like cAMP-binding protein